MKKLIIGITTLAIILTSIIPSFTATATTAPKTVTIKQYVATLLTTLNIQYTDPIQEAVNQKWVSKGHKLIANPSAAITKEQSAQLLYGVLRTKEGVKPDLYYERILNYYIGDSKNIDPSYKRAVYATIMNGFYEPQLVKNITKYFNPKNKLSENEMKLIMIRLLDKSKRYDPFQYDEKTWTIDKFKSWGLAPGVKKDKSNIVYPKLSTTKINMLFENEMPIQNKESVIKDLLEKEHNKYKMSFVKYELYDEYVNTVPVAYQDYMDVEDSRKLQIEEIKQWYQATTEFMKTYFNSSYKSLAIDEKTIKMNMPSNNHIYNLIENHKKMISSNKMMMKCYFVSDEKTFYYFPGTTYIRGRLYFKIDSAKTTVPFVTNSDYYKENVINVKSGTWYYVDVDARVAISANDDGEKWSWKGNEKGVVSYYMISDVYEITTRK